VNYCWEFSFGGRLLKLPLAAPEGGYQGVAGVKGGLGRAEMLNAERAIANTKTIGEAASRLDGVK
jgi:hypothetical protein